MTQTLALAADHGGFELKRELLSWLQGKGYTVQDLGAHDLDPDDDFPDFSYAVAQRVASGRAWRGVIICGSGVGACVTANKVPGVRASVCHDIYSARQGVEHDDMNILCLGARIIDPKLARELLSAFLKAEFLNQERYQRRLNKLLSIENSFINLDTTTIPPNQ